MAEIIRHPFEAGRRGKPDELDSLIANRVAAHFLRLAVQHQKEECRFDLRVHGTFEDDKPTVHVSGEASSWLFDTASLDLVIEDIARMKYNEFHPRLDRGQFKAVVRLKKQNGKLAENEHSGDSGDPIGVAYANSPLNLPWERFLAVAIRDGLDGYFDHYSSDLSPKLIFEGVREMGRFRADGKVNVNGLYRGADLQGLGKITLAVEHEEDLSVAELRERLAPLVREYLEHIGQSYQVNLGTPKIVINGLGDWNRGGWAVDEGSREAKPYRDGFGSHGCAEDSFAGEDPSKPSATGTLLAFYIARQIVSHGWAKFARVTLGYTIGDSEVDVNVVTQDTGDQEKLETWVRDNFSLRLSTAAESFQLRDPSLIRRIINASDYFQDKRFPWHQEAVFGEDYELR